MVTPWKLTSALHYLFGAHSFKIWFLYAAGDLADSYPFLNQATEVITPWN